jgi:hypothetical protein
MTDSLARLDCLIRPRLLIGAARFGLAEWRRDRDLRRLLRRTDLPAPGTALDELLALEEAQEECRTLRAASYVIARHVEILTALMAEARLARARTDANAAALPDAEGPFIPQLVVRLG